MYICSRNKRNSITMSNTETKYNYDFKNKKVKRAFQKLAFDTGTTLQDLITEALREKYPQIKQQ